MNNPPTTSPKSAKVPLVYQQATRKSPRLCFALGVFLLMVALPFGVVPLFVRHWVVADEYVLEYFPMPNTQGVDIDWRMGIWDSCWEVGDQTDCIGLIKYVKQRSNYTNARFRTRSFDLAPPQFVGSHDGYSKGLRHAIRSVQAFMIMGCVFCLLGICAACATFFVPKTRSKWMGPCVATCLLAFMAFVCWLVAYIVWMVASQHTYRDKTSGAFIRLKCQNSCDFGYAVWFVLTALLLALLASVCFCIAGNPYQKLQRAIYDPPPLLPIQRNVVYKQPEPIFVPPAPVLAPPPAPAPIVIQSPPPPVFAQPAPIYQDTSPIFI